MPGLAVARCLARYSGCSSIHHHAAGKLMRSGSATAAGGCGFPDSQIFIERTLDVKVTAAFDASSKELSAAPASIDCGSQVLRQIAGIPGLEHEPGAPRRDDFRHAPVIGHDGRHAMGKAFVDHT